MAVVGFFLQEQCISSLLSDLAENSFFPGYLSVSQGLRIISEPGLTPILKVIKFNLLEMENLCWMVEIQISISKHWTHLLPHVPFHLEIYMEILHLRADVDKLFVCSASPWGLGRINSICGWIKCTLQAVGIDVKQFGAHSCFSDTKRQHKAYISFLLLQLSNRMETPAKY